MTDLILAADIHTREDNPICRVDNFREALRAKFAWLRELQYDHGGIPVAISGDLFHRWKATPREISMMIGLFPKPCIIIPGQHDLPAHNLNEIKRSGLLTFALSSRDIHLLKKPDVALIKKKPGGAIKELRIFGFPWGVDPDDALKRINKAKRARNIAIIHHHVYKGRKPFPGADMGVSRFIKKFEGFDLILTGDNHLPFTHQYEDTLLVNPGSFTRQKADQINHKPRVFLYNAEENSATPEFIPIKDDVISREHIEEIEIKDQRVQAFVRRLKDDGLVISMSFEENLKEFIAENKLSPLVIERIWRAFEEEK